MKMILPWFKDIGWRHSRCPSAFISFLAIVARAEGTCNEEQINACRQAALSGRFESLRSSGECLAKPYTEFSHLCSVNNYLPTVDYCCCRHHQDMLLCCRYHQDWNRFRCQEADDAITTRVGQKGALVDLPPLEILLPSTLVPLSLILFCCLLCLISCCWYRRNQRRRQKNGNDAVQGYFCNLLQGCSCCCCPGSKKKNRQLQRANRDGTSGGAEAANLSRSLSADEDSLVTTTPLNDRIDHDQLRPLAVPRLPQDPSLYPRFGTDDYYPCPHLVCLYAAPPSERESGAFLEPSAPPASDVIPFTTANYHRGIHGVITSYEINDHCACANHPLFELNDNIARGEGDARAPSIVMCATCARLQPPPPYDESLTHRVV